MLEKAMRYAHIAVWHLLREGPTVWYKYANNQVAVL